MKMTEKKGKVSLTRSKMNNELKWLKNCFAQKSKSIDMHVLAWWQSEIILFVK